MYIHPIQHKGREEKVKLMQLNGWAFESHCWLDEGGWPRTCQWCGQVALGDMDPDAFHVCTKNPFVEFLLQIHGEKIRESVAAGAAPEYDGPVPELHHKQ